MRDFAADLTRRIGNLERRVAQLEALDRREHYPFQVMLNEAQYGGGRVLFGFDGASVACYGAGSTSQWTERGGLTAADYMATTNGACYVDLDGAEDLYISDAAWQEAGGEELLVMAWVNHDSITGTARTIASKYTTAADQRSWLLYHPTSNAYKFLANALGTAVGNVEVGSSHAITDSTWLFIAGFYEPSTTLRIFVGAATEASLTVDSNTTSIPASLFDGSPPLAVGSYENGASGLWLGNIGPVVGWTNVPVTNVNSYVDRVFRLTRNYYRA